MGSADVAKLATSCSARRLPSAAALVGERDEGGRGGKGAGGVESKGGVGSHGQRKGLRRTLAAEETSEERAPRTPWHGGGAVKSDTSTKQTHSRLGASGCQGYSTTRPVKEEGNRWSSPTLPSTQTHGHATQSRTHEAVSTRTYDSKQHDMTRRTSA